MTNAHCREIHGWDDAEHAIVEIRRLWPELVSERTCAIALLMLERLKKLNPERPPDLISLNDEGVIVLKKENASGYSTIQITPDGKVINVCWCLDVPINVEVMAQF